MSQLENPHDLLNEAVLIYMGATASRPGYQPVGSGEDRLKHSFPEQASSLIRDVDAILKAVMRIEVDWNQLTFQDAGNFVSNELATLLPWLSPEARESLTSYFLYQWR